MRQDEPRDANGRYAVGARPIGSQPDVSSRGPTTQVSTTEVGHQNAVRTGAISARLHTLATS